MDRANEKEVAEYIKCRSITTTKAKARPIGKVVAAGEGLVWFAIGVSLMARKWCVRVPPPVRVSNQFRGRTEAAGCRALAGAGDGRERRRRRQGGDVVATAATVVVVDDGQIHGQR